MRYRDPRPIIPARRAPDVQRGADNHRCANMGMAVQRVTLAALAHSESRTDGTPGEPDSDHSEPGVWDYLVAREARQGGRVR